MPSLPKEVQEGFKNNTLPQAAMERLQRNLKSGKLRFDQSTGDISTGEETLIPQVNLKGSKQSRQQAVKTGFQEEAREFGADVLPQALEMVGGGVGEVVGSRLGPGGRVVGSGAGSAIGRMGGETLRSVGAIPGDKLSPRGILESGVAAGAAGAAGTGIGGMIGKIFQKGKAPFRSSFSREGARAQKELEGLGSFLPPAKRTDSKTLDVLDNIAEASLFGGGALANLEKKNVGLITDELDNIVSSFTKQSTKEETGQLVQIAMDDAAEAFKVTARSQFGAVDKLTKGVSVNLTPLKNSVRQFQQQAKAGLGSASQDSLFKTILEKPDSITFRDAQTLRSDLLSVTRTSTDPLSNRMVGQAKNLAKTADTAMIQGIDNADFLDPTIALQGKEAFRKANKFYRDGKTKFNNTFMKALINNTPDVVLDKLLKAGKTTRLREVRTEVLKTPGGKATWNKVQGAFMEKLIGPVDRDVILDGAKVLRKYNSFGAQTIKEIFPNGGGIRFKRFLETLRTTQEKNPTGIGGIFIQLKQAGASAEVLGGAILFASTADPSTAIILGGPAALGAAFASKPISNWLVRGSKLSPRSKLGINFTTRLATMLTKEGIPFQRASETDLGQDLKQVAAAMASEGPRIKR